MAKPDQTVARKKRSIFRARSDDFPDSTALHPGYDLLIVLEVIMSHSFHILRTLVVCLLISASVVSTCSAAGALESLFNDESSNQSRPKSSKTTTGSGLEGLMRDEEEQEARKAALRKQATATQPVQIKTSGNSCENELHDLCNFELTGGYAELLAIDQCKSIFRSGASKGKAGVLEADAIWIDKKFEAAHRASKYARIRGIPRDKESEQFVIESRINWIKDLERRGVQPNNELDVSVRYIYHYYYCVAHLDEGKAKHEENEDDEKDNRCNAKPRFSVRTKIEKARGVVDYCSTYLTNESPFSINCKFGGRNYHLYANKRDYLADSWPMSLDGTDECKVHVTCDKVKEEFMTPSDREYFRSCRK